MLKTKGLTSDQTIELTGAKAKNCPIRLRRIGYKDANTGIHYTFLTNHFTLAAKTIADIYKARWQIELFFKWSKQNLKIKSFLGTSKNAVLTPNMDRHVRVFAAQLNQVFKQHPAQSSTDTETFTD